MFLTNLLGKWLVFGNSTQDADEFTIYNWKRYLSAKLIPVPVNLIRFITSVTILCVRIMDSFKQNRETNHVVPRYRNFLTTYFGRNTGKIYICTQQRIQNALHVFYAYCTIQPILCSLMYVYILRIMVHIQNCLVLVIIKAIMLHNLHKRNFKTQWSMMFSQLIYSKTRQRLFAMYINRLTLITFGNFK